MPQPMPPDEDNDQNDEPYQDASQSTADFIQNVKPIQERKQKSHKLRKTIIVLLVVIALGAAAYFIGTYMQDSKKKETKKEAPAETKKPAKTEGTQTYTSDEMNLSLKYPGTWSVDESDPKHIQIKSPTIQLPDTTGKQTNTQVAVNVVPTNKENDLPADQATAVMPSEKFAYTSPAEGQRQETYLSFLNPSGESTGLGAAYISGDATYVKGDPVRKADFDNIQPVIWIDFHCVDDACTSDQKVIIPAEQWGTNSTLKEAFTIIKSLNVK